MKPSMFSAGTASSFCWEELSRARRSRRSEHQSESDGERDTGLIHSSTLLFVVADALRGDGRRALARARISR